MWQRAAKVAGREAGRHGRAFVQHILPAIVKPAHALWNEVIGFIFLCMATPCAFKAARYAIAGDHPRLLIATIPTILLAWLGIHSFVVARRISRS